VGTVSSAVRRARPAPVDVVTADQAGELITSAERRLAELESKRAAAEEGAAAAERRAGDEPMEPELHTWAKQQLERLARELKEEQEVELASKLDDARARARECVDRAHREADVIISYVRAIHSVRTPDEPGPGSATGSTPDDPVLAEPPAPPVAQVPPEPEAELVPPPAPALPEPAPEGDAAPPPAAPRLPDLEEPTGRPAGEVPSPGRDEEFWSSSPEPKLRHLLRRAPGLAVLQVLAVLVILAVVLLRVG
jgi:hypothetical protein